MLLFYGDPEVCLLHDSAPPPKLTRGKTLAQAFAKIARSANGFISGGLCKR
ncbi:hypothetical protein SVI_0117 [Shewanella violacea DSS12]|uniref:Uncharacterized protein n=1 Tax=Shewanella violacea (strain JCM 10179 / CIP 106290 / LMG 19151 / DSS12) TaxID=637905 RepID=D4ZDG6_SHEVD|nr:hypothetical protein SVI_0117 [Shewanella violacea DSS12]